MKLGNDPAALLALSPLERAVLRTFAVRLGAASSTAQSQADRATVVSRTHSGVGFVTKLSVPDDATALPGALAGRPVEASHPALREPAEFLVQVKNGRIASIEAFCHEGMWPAEEAGFRIGAP